MTKLSLHGKTAPVIRTREDLNAHVALRVTQESEVLEFKQEIDGLKTPRGTARDDKRAETARDLAQFANALGGCLLIGLSEKNGTAATWVPLEDPDATETWIRNVVKDWLVPSTMRVDVHRIAVPDGTVLAVQVPASRELVAVWDRKRNSIQYVCRIGRDKRYLNPGEVELALNDRSRSARIAYHRVHDRLTQLHAGTLPVELVPPLVVDSGQALNVYVAGATEDELVLHIGVQYHGEEVVHLPWSLVDDVWVTAGSSCGLLLRARIHCSAGRAAWLEAGPLWSSS